MNFTLDPLLSGQQIPFGNLTTLIFPFFNTNALPVTNSFGRFLFYGTTVPVSSSIGVSDFSSYAIQASIVGSGSIPTGSFTVQSTVDGVNLVPEFTITNLANSQSIFRLSAGRRLYLLATYSGSGNATGSLYLLAGQS